MMFSFVNEILFHLEVRFQLLEIVVFKIKSMFLTLWHHLLLISELIIIYMYSILNKFSVQFEVTAVISYDCITKVITSKFSGDVIMIVWIFF